MGNYNVNTYENRLTPANIYRNIGYAHHSTLQTTSVNKEKIQKDFEQYYDKCMEYQDRFDHYIDEFEQKRYMAPVELLVCTHYRDIDYLFKELFVRIEQFNSELMQVNEWKYCLCYGQKNIKNLLTKGHLYQNSHEHYFNGNAVIDIVTMIKYQLYFVDLEAVNLSEYFSVYLEGNQLDQIEKELLAIYLLDPTDYFQAVEGYATGTSDESMMGHVITLKRYHRFLLQMVNWTRNNLGLDEIDPD